MDLAPPILIAATALGAAFLTFFTGFGLGTVLMPAFAVFFPAPVAIAATAVVHLANNLFKLALVGRDAHRQVSLRFGAPAALGAIPGALLLPFIANLPALYEGSLLGASVQITPVGLVVGGLILVFAFPLAPRLGIAGGKGAGLIIGGLVSGFFGGLSGHQGAIRSAVLIRMGLTRDAFIGTRVVCAVIVDVVRLSVYAGAALLGGAGAPFHLPAQAWTYVGVGSAAAFAGSFVGVRLVKTTTIGWLRVIVSVGLALLGLAMMLGFI